MPRISGVRNPKYRTRIESESPFGCRRHKPIRRDLTTRWLLNAEKLAGLLKLTGGQFHRLWATERKDLPVQDVAAAGGWKTVETVQRIYQQADGATTLAAVEAGP